MFRFCQLALLFSLAITTLSRAVEATPNGYVVKRWDLDDGLPLITVKDILQGSDGYLWLGTWDTISRFDGVHFETYDLVNHPEMLSGNSEVIYEDPNGDVWMGTTHSLIRWRRGNLTIFGEEHGLTNTYVKGLARDAEGVLWVGTDEGLHREISPGRFELVSLREEEHEPRIDAMIADGDTLWIGSWEGLFRKRVGSPLERMTETMRVNTMAVDRHGRVVMKVLPQSLMRLERDGTLRSFGVLNAGAFTRLRNGELWAGMRDSRVLKLSDDLTEKPQLVLQMSGAEVHTIYEDRENNVWIGASGTGLTCLMPRAFDLISETLGLPYDHFGCFCKRQNGELYLGTFGRGVYQLLDNQWIPVPYGDGIKIPQENGNITAICETLDGSELWMATMGGILGVFREGEIHTAGSVNRCRALCPDAESGMWIASNDWGIFLVRDGKDIAHLHMEHGLSNNEIHAMALDQDGNLWVSTQHGLNRLRDGKFTSYFREDGLGINAMRALYAGSDGTLWIATGGAGLVRHRNGVFDRLTTEHGLATNFPTSMLEDQSGNLWIGTTNGLCVAPVETIHRALDDEAVSHIPFRTFGKRDGITLPTIGTGFQPTGIQLDNGQIWFVAGRELLVFDALEFSSTPARPTVAIRAIEFDGQRILSPRNDIPAGSNRLTFHYSGTQLTDPGQLLFEYRLEGYDNDWIDAGAAREATYSHVPPGHYHFQIKCRNGASEVALASTPLRVLPAWWQTWWFRGLYGLAALSTLAGAYLWRRARWREARKVQERFAAQLIKGQEEERQRIAAELHDGLGQSLLVAKNQITITRKEVSSDDPLASQLQAVSETMTSTLDEVRTIAHALRPYELDRLGFTHAVMAMIDRLRTSHHLDVRTKITPIDGRLDSSSELGLYRVMQEALNNVVKHAEATSLDLTIEEDDATIRLSIQDDGKGIDPDGLGAREGMGLMNMAERLRLLGGELHVESTYELGTKVTVTLPIKS